MGLRRLRGRLDQLQGNANFTMAQAQELIALAKDLLDDLKDGIGISAQLEDNAARTLMGMVLKGRGGKIPMTVEVDPTYDTLPGPTADFVGGSYDGENFHLNESQRKRAIVLQPDEMYVWDGHKFRYQGKAEPQEM